MRILLTPLYTLKILVHLWYHHFLIASAPSVAEEASSVDANDDFRFFVQTWMIYPWSRLGNSNRNGQFPPISPFSSSERTKTPASCLENKLWYSKCFNSEPSALTNLSKYSNLFGKLFAQFCGNSIFVKHARSSFFLNLPQN